MLYQYQGHFSFDYSTVNNWNSNAIGVYYCGYILPDGNLFVCYIGRAVGQDGIRGRLLQHLNPKEWSEATHFGYVVADTIKEAEDFEAAEIKRLNPKYNIQGKIF